jgi:hypothetical protein
VHATLLGGPRRQDLKAPQMVLFLDKGKQDGVARGDLFEIRRHPERLDDGMAELAGWLAGQAAVDRVAQASAELSARGLTV